MPNSTQTHIAAVPRAVEEVEHIVALERLHRYNYGLPCGAAALRRHLREEISLHPLPSLRRIRQILTQYGLTYGRTGWYEGEDLDWLPASARVPEAQRRHFSMIEVPNDR
jgi:hypothetical protein